MIEQNGHRTLSIEDIARINYEAKRQLRISFGEPPGARWHEVDRCVKDSFIASVQAAMEGATPEGLHELWLEQKGAKGWSYGPIRDYQNRRHPCIMPYEQLPEGQKLKDDLLFGIVRALTKASEHEE